MESDYWKRNSECIYSSICHKSDKRWWEKVSLSLSCSTLVPGKYGTKDAHFWRGKKRQLFRSRIWQTRTAKAIRLFLLIIQVKWQSYGLFISAAFFTSSEIVISYIAAGSFEIENPALWSNWNEFSIFMDTFHREEEETVFLPTWLVFNFGPRLDIFIWHFRNSVNKTISLSLIQIICFNFCALIILLLCKTNR